MITGDQIRQARKLLGWHRGQIAIRARGITNTVGKAEGAFPGKPPSLEELAEIPAMLEAAGGVEFQHGDPAGMRLKSPAPPRAL